MVGDGEIEEGLAWESFMFASHYNLDNLTIICDRNFLQIDGDTEKVISLRAADPQKLNGIIFPVDGLTLEHVGPQPIHFDSYRDMKKFAKENNIGLYAVDGH